VTTSTPWWAATKAASRDVVNEALEEDGTLRQTPRLKIIGEDYIAKAFQFAHEAETPRHAYARYLLGCDRRRFLVE